MGRAGMASDVFTWAVTVTFAAGGRAPFGTGAADAVMYRIVHEAPDLSAVPPGLRPLVEAALAKDPQARPTAAQLLGQLASTQLASTRLASTTARYENATEPCWPRPGTRPRPARWGQPPDPPAPPGQGRGRPAAAPPCSRSC